LFSYIGNTDEGQMESQMMADGRQMEDRWKTMKVRLVP